MQKKQLITASALGAKQTALDKPTQPEVAEMVVPQVVGPSTQSPQKSFKIFGSYD